MTLDALARRAARLTGWRRPALAALLGASAALAFPPVYALPVLIPAVTGLLWQLDGVRTRRGAAVLGWVFGLGHFTAGLYWVGLSFFVGAPELVPLMPLAVLGLAAGLAVFPALAVLAVWHVPAAGGARVPALAAAWTGAAWLRGHVLTGFPWNLMGSVWTVHAATMQSAAWWGVWGLSLLTVLGAAAPAALTASGRVRARVASATGAAGVLALAVLAGVGRFASAPATETARKPDVRLRLVQGAIPQAEKWAPELRRRNLRRYLAMSEPDAGEPAPTHVIWPESAVPYLLRGSGRLADRLGAVVPPGGALLAGLTRADGDEALFNSLAVITRAGEVRAHYDKAHLVPFGEYMPLSAWLPLDKLAHGRVSYSAGPGPRVLDVPGAPPVSPLICYEAIFPGAVVPAGQRPGWLLNVSNDAWFGRSAGPYQHLAAARLRAVEQGLPLVRAANSGVSAVIDAHGRTRARLGLGERATLTIALPAAPSQPTPYARYGDRVPLALGVLAVLAAAGIVAGTRRSLSVHTRE